MDDLLKRLSAINIIPSRGTDEFQVWLKQRDALNFLHANAEEIDCVVYASFPQTLILSVIVPSSRLSPPDIEDLLHWGFNSSETWGISCSQTEVKLESPLHHADAKTLIGGEPLLFSRRFEGAIQHKSYIEVLQKFSHIFDLHFTPERNAYCRLDDNGDVEDVIRIFITPRHGERGGDRFVTFNRRELDEYMVLTDCALVRLFDFTRFDPSNFTAWTNSRKSQRIAEGDLQAELTIDSGQGSYSRGFQIIRPKITKQHIIDRVWRRSEHKQYASFIAYDWKNGVIRDISCNPKHLANYFTKSDLPFEITPAFFKPEVLQKYKADSAKYKLDERSISCRGAWSLQTYDINEAGQVHTYLIYLSRLPYEEQLYWKSFNERPRASISKRAYQTDFEGQFSSEFDPFSHLKHHLRELHSAEVQWWVLRADELFDKAHQPVTSSATEWGNDLLALDQLLVEGFDERWLRQQATRLGRNPESQFRSLKLIEECLVGLGFEPDHAASIVAPMRELHDLRTKLKGHAAGTSAAELQSKALSTYGSYREHFKNLCASCDEGIQEIRHAFARLNSH
jgi:hypothetical protein